jgi:hypothetical protein
MGLVMVAAGQAHTVLHISSWQESHRVWTIVAWLLMVLYMVGPSGLLGWEWHSVRSLSGLAGRELRGVWDGPRGAAPCGGNRHAVGTECVGFVRLVVIV